MKEFKSLYKKIANAKQNTATHALQLAILKAIKAKSNGEKKDIAAAILYKSFTPITNETKLANGAKAYEAVKATAGYLYFSSSDWARREDGTSYRKFRDKVKIFDVPFNEIFENEFEIQLYFEILEGLLKDPDQIARHYTYIFVRQDLLSPEQVAVQAAHATFVAGAKLDYRMNPAEVYFTLVGVNGPVDWKNLVLNLNDHGTKYSKFVEPDLGFVNTAIATQPIHSAARGALRNYELLTFNKDNVQVA